MLDCGSYRLLEIGGKVGKVSGDTDSEKGREQGK